MMILLMMPPIQTYQTFGLISEILWVPLSTTIIKKEKDTDAAVPGNICVVSQVRTQKLAALAACQSEQKSDNTKRRITATQRTPKSP
jgi:hypothetical protein